MSDDGVTLTQIDKDEILAMRKTGKTLQVIADAKGVSRERVRQILEEIAPGYQPLKKIHYRRFFHAIAVVASKLDQLDPDFYPHGTIRGYQRGCSCDLCRTANRERTYKIIGYEPKTARPELRGPRRTNSSVLTLTARAASKK